MRRAALPAVLVLAALAAPAGHAAVPGRPWLTDVLAPSSRLVQPVAVRSTTGQVRHATALLGNGTATLVGKGAQVVLDLGRDVGGLVEADLGSRSTAGAKLDLAFSESSLFVGPQSDASTGRPTGDGAVEVTVTPGSHYRMPPASLRGGFRYLTLVLASDGSVAVSHVRVLFTADPARKDLRAYPTHFWSSDPLLNRIWYAGAYTVQLGTIDAHQGRFFPFPPTGWDNSAGLASSGSLLVDGAKRDRALWPGDLGVAFPTDYVALDDLATMRNSLDTLYAYQLPDGALPYAGPAVNFPGGCSDTYHLWSLIATDDYVRYSHDVAWLRAHWSAYTSAVAYSLRAIEPTTGLLYVVGQADWGRNGQGKENIAANALLYGVLQRSAALATLAGSTDGSSYAARASALRSAINAHLWDPTAEAYQDNPSTPTLHPQDGNALAVWLGVADSGRAQLALRALRRNWLARGAHTPEWKGIHPFPGSLEVFARFSAGDADGALALIRREWGYMLAAPIGTGSTFWEGYLDDGAFGYEGAFGAGYTSLAHGWSTGPTSALTFDVLGIHPSYDGHYLLRPQPGDLRYAEGDLRLAEGDLAVSWERGPDRFLLRLHAPARTTGEVDVSAGSTVRVDGRIVWQRGRARGLGARMQNGYVELFGLPPGAHRVEVSR